MPVNRFDVAQGQRYVSTYVPLPFEELAAVGERMQKNTLAKEAEMSQLEKLIADTKVANQVFSEGSGDDRGLKYRNTGYGEYKNQLLDKARTAHQQITDDYLAGKLTPQQLAQKTNEFNNQFKTDYQKLKIAEANSANIFKQDEEYRKNQEVGQKTYLANQLGKEGARLLSDPFGVDYKGAPINKGIDEIETLNKFAGQFQDKILKNSSSWKDQYGKIHYKSTTGVGENDIRTAVSAAFEQDNIGHDYRERVQRQLNDSGKSWNDKIEINVPTYDKQGKQTGTEKKKVNLGDYIYNHEKEQFTLGVIAKARKENPDEKIMSDEFGDWQKKRAVEDQDAKKHLIWTAATTPSDPNNPNNTYAGMNNSISTSSFGKLWKFDDKGELVSNVSKDNYVPGFTIDGQVYASDKPLPSGYTTRLNDNGTKVLVKNGKDVAAETYLKNTDKGNIQEAINELYKIAQNLGITKQMSKPYQASAEGLHQIKREVASYFKQAYQLEMDYVRMDPGSMKLLTDQFGVQSDIDSKGNMTIKNPGSLAFAEIRDANGNLVDPASKAKILSNANILGPAFSLTNDKSKPGDMKLQSTDGNAYTINTGMRNINNALTEPYQATKALHNYVMTGKKQLSAEDKEHLSVFDTQDDGKVNLKRDAVALVNKNNVSYAYYVKEGLDSQGNVQMAVYKITPNASYPITIAEANAEISKENMFEIMPSQNPKNIDRLTSFDSVKASELPASEQ